MIADIALHAPGREGDERNHHAHILLTTREIGPDGFTTKNRDWNAKDLLEEWREAWAQDSNAALERAGVDARIDHRTLAAQRDEALELAADATARGDEAEAVHQRVRAVELDRAPLPQLSPGAWQMKERGIEVAAVRVWNEVKAQAREVARIAQDLAGKARDWLERSVEQVRDAVERPASSDPWGDFFAQAAADGVSDGLSRDLKAEQRHSETRQQAEHELELQRKERNGHALRDRSDDYELGY